ncbi:CHAD domain-containing protein [Peteryoungia algae]|uniref:CHAD domain-containing protein n=1 Tax=Peteryoungia algae TaxID=2919917 RepID=A0ABT0CYZ8_9HYPH|nr:CHAD domain-containing protein [Rhizobium sp. SSM4.3]MCJ8238169.1 CHAD domain-containing protein [Rhizobium sp. SSM4.3]
MPYRIRPDRPLLAEVQNVARRELEKAIETLEARPEGLHEAIHAARKIFKRLRNLYRLVARGDKAFWRRENTRLREAARSLSSIRDATALIETVEHLSVHALTDDEAETLAAAREVLALRRDDIAESERDLEAKVSGVVTECRAAVSALHDLSLPSKAGHTARLVARGWRRSLDEAHEALDTCKGESHGEAFHDLRKASQAYWMNLSLLSDLWPSAFCAKRRDAKRLVDLLGHEHDLTVLITLLDQEPEIFGNGEGQSFLLAIIIRRQMDLRREALTLAGRIFADAAKDEADIIETLWMRAAIQRRTG